MLGVSLLQFYAINQGWAHCIHGGRVNKFHCKVEKGLFAATLRRNRRLEVYLRQAENG
jgi:hypothetical protein